MDQRPIIVAYCTPGPYEAEARRLLASADRVGVPVELTVLPDRGSWQANTMAKQQFLAAAWRTHGTADRGILYVDADAVLHADPKDYYTRPPASQCDVAVHHVRGRVSNGTLFLRRTPRARLLLAAWAEVNAERPNRLEQDNLGEAMKRVAGLVVHPLPPEHCWIFDLSPRIYGHRIHIIEHLQASRTHRKRRRREHHTRVRRRRTYATRATRTCGWRRTLRSDWRRRYSSRYAARHAGRRRACCGGVCTTGPGTARNARSWE